MAENDNNNNQQKQNGSTSSYSTKGAPPFYKLPSDSGRFQKRNPASNKQIRKFLAELAIIYSKNMGPIFTLKKDDNNKGQQQKNENNNNNNQQQSDNFKFNIKNVPPEWRGMFRAVQSQNASENNNNNNSEYGYSKFSKKLKEDKVEYIAHMLPQDVVNQIMKHLEELQKTETRTETKPNIRNVPPEWKHMFKAAGLSTGQSPATSLFSTTGQNLPNNQDQTKK